jgi:hypothetical protein
MREHGERRQDAGHVGHETGAGRDRVAAGGVGAVEGDELPVGRKAGAGEPDVARHGVQAAARRLLGLHLRQVTAPRPRLRGDELHRTREQDAGDAKGHQQLDEREARSRVSWRRL